MKQKEAPQMRYKGHSDSSVLSRSTSDFTERIYGRAGLLNLTGKRDQTVPFFSYTLTGSPTYPWIYEEKPG